MVRNGCLVIGSVIIWIPMPMKDKYERNLVWKRLAVENDVILLWDALPACYKVSSAKFKNHKIQTKLHFLQISTWGKKSWIGTRPTVNSFNQIQDESWPVAHTFPQGDRLRFMKPCQLKVKGLPGEILSISRGLNCLYEGTLSQTGSTSRKPRWLTLLPSLTVWDELC